MPPKKKKGKKSGKKKSARKSAKGSASKIAEALNELSKEFYLVQIRDLEQKLTRYQTRCDELEVKNKEVDSKFDQQASDKKEIVSFLKKQLEQRADEIADLQERLIGLQHAKDSEKDKFELQMTTLRTEMQEMKDKLTSENMVLGGKLASLEEFRVQKEDLLNKFEEMEELLKKQENDHTEQIYQLERKAVVDKDRLKKEMILRVNTVASEFRKVSNKQMAETTKRTIRENVMINSQLSKMSDKTMEMIGENEDLKVKEKKQKQRLEILEFNEKELMKKNAANLKIIRMLTEKSREQEDSLRSYEERELVYKQLEHDFEQTKAELDEVTKTLNSVIEEKKVCEKKVTTLKKTRRDLVGEKEKLVSLLADAADVIKDALQQAANDDLAQKEYRSNSLLQKVIDILDLAVEMGVGINPVELQKKSIQLRSDSTSPCDVTRIPSRRSSVPAKPLFSPVSRPLAHYKLGDLGLVPPPKVKKPISRSAGYVPSRKKDFSKATFFTDEQLARGTPEPSTYNLVKDISGGVMKLPALSPIKQ